MPQEIRFSIEKNRDLGEIAAQITKNFTKSDWLHAGLALGFLEEIQAHDRLLRALRFNDDDYPSCVIEVISGFAHAAKTNLPALKAYISDMYGTPQVSEFISTAHTEVPKKMIQFAPQVFGIPDKPQNDKLVAVMLPFSLQNTFESVKATCTKLGLECLKGDDIWNNSTFIQDIFEIIYTSKVVVADFSGKNPNVFYEVGIAHTLGKTVVPMVQHIDDLPSDLRHHRAIIYVNNGEGLAKMAGELEKRLQDLFPDVNNYSF